jgi:hypothetical protein
MCKFNIYITTFEQMVVCMEKKEPIKLEPTIADSGILYSCVFKNAKVVWKGESCVNKNKEGESLKLQKKK